jgi:hypothetical protein
LASANPNASTAITRLVGKACGTSSPSITEDTLAKVVASRANQPVVSDVGAWGSMPVMSIRPCVGRMP